MTAFKLNFSILTDWIIGIMLIFFQLYYIFPNFLVVGFKIIFPTTALLFMLFVKKENIRNKVFICWFYILIFVSLISLFYSVSITSSIDIIVSLLSTMLMMMAVSQYIDEVAALDKVINYLIIGGTLYALYIAIVQGKSLFVSGIDPELANGSGMQVTYVITPTMYYLIWRILSRKDFRLISIGATVLLFIISISTGGKKAIFFPLIFLIVLLMIRNRKSFVKIITYSIVGIWSLFLLYKILIQNELLFEIVGSRIETFTNFFTGEGRVDGSTLARISLIKESWDVFLNNPIFGIGIGAFKDLSSLGLYSHNNFTELLAGIGLVGFISYYWVIAYLLICLIKLLNKNNNNITELLIALLVTNLFHDIATVSYYRSSFVMFVCLASSYVSLERNLKRTSN